MIFALQKRPTHELKFDPAGLKDQFGMRFKNAQPRFGGGQNDHMTKLAVNN